FSAFFLLPLYIKDLGGDEANIGFIMGSFGITSLGAIPFVAYLVDKFGRRKFMLLGYGIMFAASLGYLFISHLSPVFYLLRF
ncbi:MAG: MFS transporter, partial [Nitrosopumilaceae archaeon]|nr:MFS transporter [Nitrosopumilaceae archaeon]